jgi:hypothetical protein
MSVMVDWAAKADVSINSIIRMWNKWRYFIVKPSFDNDRLIYLVERTGRTRN